jgi:hypothetical protein
LLLLILLLLLLLLLSSSSFSKYSSNIASFRTWFESCVSNQNFTDGFLLKFYLFFLAIAWDPQSSALFRLLCMTGHSFRNIIPVRYEWLIQWEQNRSKAMMWLLYKNSSYSRVPKTLLLDWQLYVACYYPTTPTDYLSTTRGMSVGLSVAVNIEFCGYLQFLSINFVWIIWVHTSLTTFLVNN